MADLSDSAPGERTGSERPSDEELHRKALNTAYKKVVGPWLAEYSDDRAVMGLSFRSDPVRRVLERLVADAMDSARAEAIVDRYNLSEKQRAKYDAWYAEQQAKVLADQQAKNPNAKRPYFGAIGGSVTFQTTATSLGSTQVFVFCKGTKWEAELDVTEYEDW